MFQTCDVDLGGWIDIPNFSQNHRTVADTVRRISITFTPAEFAELFSHANGFNTP